MSALQESSECDLDPSPHLIFRGSVRGAGPHHSPITCMRLQKMYVVARPLKAHVAGLAWSYNPDACVEVGRSGLFHEEAECVLFQHLKVLRPP